MFKRKTFLTLALLTSVVSLTACGQKSSQSTPASSQSKVVQSSSSSSLFKAKTTTSTETSVNQEEASSEAPSTETSSSSGEASPALMSSVDLDAIANGDFSSIVGTWANAKGTILMITVDGKLYYDGEQNEHQHHQLEQFDFNHGRCLVGNISYYNNGERQGGAAISIVPAGVENSLGLVSEFDHLEIGHGIHSSQADEQYFRQ